MAERKSMGDTELKALIARELSLADSDRSDASKRLTKALEYYQGEVKDIVSETGRSSVVSRDFADVMGWMLPGIIRVFTASDRMALCEPVGDEDEAFAKQATQGVNYTFFKENDGYRVLYDGTWDSLAAGNGVVKVWWDETPRDVVSYHSGLTDDALAELVSGDDVEVLAHSESVDQVPGPDGVTVPLPVHEVKIRRKIKGGRTCVETIPPEDYGKDGRSRTCQAARFQFHRSDKSRSDLIEMGFDAAVIDGLNRSSAGDDPEAIARDDGPTEGEPDTSTEIIDLYECYVRVDVDGDGIAEMVRVYFAGNKSGGEVLDWEVWEDEAPFYDIPCDPMPHRWQARSVFDETEDVQQVKTVMLRQANDNTYATNNPQRHVKGKITNPEELFSPNFGSVIFGDVNSEIVPLTVPFVANHAYDALAYQDQVVQRRTGVSRQTMALDPEALQNQSATANQNEKDASYSQVELVARNMAEFGWVNVFKAILRIEVKHQDAARTIRMGGKPVKIDPRWWNTDMDVTINVGLGTGSRDRDAMMLGQVLAQQIAFTDRIGAVFPGKAMDMLQYIHNTLTRFAESTGLKNPEHYWPEIDPQEIEQGKQQLEQRAQQPDPKTQADMAKMQADQQLQQDKMQSDQQMSQQQMQLDAQLGQQKFSADQQRADQDFALRQRQLEAEMQLKRDQLSAELQLKREQMAAELALQRELGHANVAAKATAVTTSSVHPGGEPG